VSPGVDIQVVIGAHREGRNHVFPKIFVLIVAPDQDQVGLKRIDFLTHAPKLINQLRTVARGCRSALISPPFLAHGGRP